MNSITELVPTPSHRAPFSKQYRQLFILCEESVERHELKNYKMHYININLLVIHNLFFFQLAWSSGSSFAQSTE